MLLQEILPSSHPGAQHEAKSERLPCSQTPLPFRTSLTSSTAPLPSHKVPAWKVPATGLLLHEANEQLYEVIAAEMLNGARSSGASADEYPMDIDLRFTGRHMCGLKDAINGMPPEKATAALHAFKVFQSCLQDTH